MTIPMTFAVIVSLILIRVIGYDFQKTHEYFNAPETNGTIEGPFDKKQTEINNYGKHQKPTKFNAYWVIFEVDGKKLRGVFKEKATEQTREPGETVKVKYAIIHPTKTKPWIDYQILTPDIPYRFTRMAIASVFGITWGLVCIILIKTGILE